MTNNWMTLHTTPGCTFRSTGAARFFKTANCNSREGRDGCPQRLNSNVPSSSSSAGQAVANYGEPFNANRGGAYVMEWTSTDVHMWFLPRTTSDDDDDDGTFQTLVTAGPSTLDTAALGTPLAGFAGGGGGAGVNSTEGFGSCDVDAHFYDHTITIDTTFCGDWAGSEEGWAGDAACGKLAGTCVEWVADNPQAFREAYWLFNSIRVYAAATV